MEQTLLIKESKLDEIWENIKHLLVYSRYMLGETLQKHLLQLPYPMRPDQYHTCRNTRSSLDLTYSVSRCGSLQLASAVMYETNRSLDGIRITTASSSISRALEVYMNTHLCTYTYTC